MTASEDKLMFKPPEAGEMLSIAKSTVYQLIREGKLRAVRCNSSIYVPRQALEEFVASLSAAAVSNEGGAGGR